MRDEVGNGDPHRQSDVFGVAQQHDVVGFLWVRPCPSERDVLFGRCPRKAEGLAGNVVRDGLHGPGTHGCGHPYGGSVPRSPLRVVRDSAAVVCVGCGSGEVQEAVDRQRVILHDQVVGGVRGVRGPRLDGCAQRRRGVVGKGSTTTRTAGSANLSASAVADVRRDGWVMTATDRDPGIGAPPA